MEEKITMDDEYPFDTERPLDEQVVGYLGCTWDGDITEYEPPISSLCNFDFAEYFSLMDELEVSQRTVECKFARKRLKILIEAYQEIHSIIDLLPAVDCMYDCPPDQGPAAGSGYVFSIAASWHRRYVKKQSEILTNALMDDMSKMRLELEGS